MSNPIYLDYNATTPLLPEVVDAMIPYLREHFGNPSSGHIYGRRAHDAVVAARAQVASLIGAEPDEIVFTSGGTEASNIAIQGTTDGRVVTSVIEHPATANPVRWLEELGIDTLWLDVDGDGRVILQPMPEDTRLVTVMHANNETGVLQPIAELAERAHAVGAVMHTDAAQSLGKVRVNVDELGVDLLTIAGHKLYAPKGVGALYVRRGTPISPLSLGAGHEGGIRPGTENVASIVGLGAACEAALRDLDEVEDQMRELRDDLWARLQQGVPGIALNGHPELRLPNTLNVRFPGTTGDAILSAAPEIAASTGSACHAGETTASAVILAMGVDPVAALGSVRLSIGRSTTPADIGRAAAALIKAAT